MRKYKQPALNFFLLIVSTFLSIVAAEVCLRLFFPGIVQTYNELVAHPRFVVNGVKTPFNTSYISDPVVGYKFRKNHSEHNIDVMYGLDYSFSTNGEGFRNDDSIGKNLPSRKVMMLGDSVTFGQGVDDHETFSAKLNEIFKNKSTAFVNFGTPGWSFAEYYLTYKQYASKVNPELVVIGLFLGNDFQNLEATEWPGKADNKLPHAVERRDVYIDENGHFRNNVLSYIFPVLRNSYLWILFSERFGQARYYARFIRDRLDQVPIAANLVKEIAREHKVLLLISPSELNIQNPETLMDSSLLGIKALLSQNANITIFDLTPIIAESEAKKIKMYCDGSHYSEEGNIIVANAIARIIEDKGLFEQKK